MTEQVLRLGLPLLMFVLAVYGVGLCPSGRLPFLRLAAPARIFAWVVHAAARSRLRKSATVRDWFVYREGKSPGPQDLAKVQKQLVASFGIVLIFSLIAN